MAFIDYLIWHYTFALKSALGIWMNFFWFVYNFFSARVLLKTLFKRIYRLGDSYDKGYDIKNFFGNFVVSLLMRLFGFVLRITTLFIFLISIFLIFIFGVVAFIIWCLLPFIILILIWIGLKIIIY